MISREAGLRVLQWVLAVVLGVYSALLILEQLRSRHGTVHLFALGIAELAASVLLVFPKTVRIGGFALVVIIAAAAILHLLRGQYNVGNLAVYAAAALAVATGARRS